MMILLKKIKILHGRKALILEVQMFNMLTMEARSTIKNMLLVIFFQYSLFCSKCIFVLQDIFYFTDHMLIKDQAVDVVIHSKYSL